MKSAFLYDISVFPNYEITYFIFCLATYATVAVDTLFFGFCLNICAHFNIIRSLTFADNLNYRGFVKYHQEILELCSCLNGIYFPVIFTQFLVSSVLLCVIGFQLVMAPDFFKILVLFAFSCAILIQLFVYAYGGTLIMEESSSVAENIYQKELLFCIPRAYKNCCIKSGFYTASLPTFTKILSSAGSYITLLQSLQENK
ncbi:unnamed protein product [Diamesa serratosioi]